MKVKSFMFAIICFTFLSAEAGSADFKLNKVLSPEKMTLIFIRDADCPIARKQGPIIRDIEQKYGKKVSILFLNSLPTALDKNFVAQDRKRFGFVSPYYQDDSGQFFIDHQVETSTEAFLFQGEKLIYQGAISDQFAVGDFRDNAKKENLVEVLERGLKGEKVSFTRVPSPGCVIDWFKPFVGGDEVPLEEVKSVIGNRCVTCHHSGSATPFAFETMKDVLSRLGMIRYVVKNSIMPPWSAEPGYGPWTNDIRLSESEKKTLLSWNPEFSKIDLSERLVAQEKQRPWKAGTPDLVLSLGQIPVLKNGSRQGHFKYLKLQLPEDIWVQGFEVRSQFRKQLHHTTLYQVHEIPKSRNYCEGPAESAPENLITFIGALAWGMKPVVWKNAGFKVKKNAVLCIDIHYEPNGDGGVDFPEVGFFLHKKPPEHQLNTFEIRNLDFTIPAGASDYKVVAEQLLSKDIKIFGLYPHMHRRGSGAKIEIVEKSGAVQTIFETKRFRYNKQWIYPYQNPMTVSKGSTIRVIGTFDNSDRNPANLDSSKPVKAGVNGSDEMMIGHVVYSEN